MKLFIGSKIIQAEPMDEVTFLNEIKHQGVNQETRPGYHVIYPNPEGEYHSWSPKDVFETAYRPVTEEERSLL